MLTSVEGHSPLATDVFRTSIIIPEDATVADRTRARLLRERFLDPISSVDVPVALVDLNYLQVLTLNAADELIVRWLERVRSPRNPIVAVLATSTNDVADTLDAALRMAHQAAFRVNSRPSQTDRPQIIGEATPAQRATVELLQRAQRWLSAREFGLETQPQLSPSASTNRLTEVVTRGLALRREQAGATTFRYPLQLT